MKEFAEVTAKIYVYLTDHDSENKIKKETKKCGIKRIYKFNDYKDC